MPIIRQAGAIAVRGKGSDRQVLLVRAKKDPSHWIFPKGHIETGETPEQAAIRELREEAGVVGEILQPIGVSEFQSGDEHVQVTYFLARAVEAGQKAERPVRWYPFPEARKMLTFDDARLHLDAVEKVLQEGEP